MKRFHWQSTLLLGAASATAPGALAAEEARAADERTTRVAVGIGVAVPALNYALYDAGVIAQGGADFPLGDGRTHRLRLLGRWVGLATDGARADLGSVESAWRIYPSWGRGLLLELGAGTLLEVERFQLNLSGRSLDESRGRAGVPASVAVGFGLRQQLEVEVGYRQLFFLREEPRTVGIAHALIGGRL
jgi:hypothetical protein